MSLEANTVLEVIWDDAIIYSLDRQRRGTGTSVKTIVGTFLTGSKISNNICHITMQIVENSHRLDAPLILISFRPIPTDAGPVSELLLRCAPKPHLPHSVELTLRFSSLLSHTREELRQVVARVSNQFESQPAAILRGDPRPHFENKHAH